MIALSWVTDSTAGLAWTIPVSAGMVALVSPWSRQFAWRIGAIDRPAARKLHLRATPRLGGLSAALAVFTCVVLWLMTDPTAIEQCAQYWGLLPGALVMFLVGLYDDLFRLRPSVKLALQFVAASIICSGGICLTALDVPLLGQLHLSWLGPVLTVIWLVGVTNAMNFLDGIDGLAAGTAALA
ncbi:MAG: undecaprenyl/decaprenyl-phosphate alpha-N-acetylglucosaminyl 1-phosphate transferase, partial [Phycisphaerae bacterium]|nr:undecaprenyl/decaprenyl-phosphate alpha-N-acetylglucosaminyl 1-phosphate transferase [Phycisphaerae bacterium]